MNARYYDSTLNRFLSADTIVPDPTNPQSYNRYTYVNNNPLKYIDPTGHYLCETTGNCNSPTPYDFPVHKKDSLLLQELEKPVPGIIDGFGNERTVNCKGTECANSIHPGGDSYSTDDKNEGDPIHAVSAGEVVAVGYMNSTQNSDGTWKPTFGQYVVVQHIVYGEVYYSVYVHLEKGNVGVEVGDVVNQGDVVGGMGSTIAQSTVHLHFEIRRSTSIDLSKPLPFVIRNNNAGDFFPDNEKVLNANFVNLSSLNWNRVGTSPQREQRGLMP